MAAPISPLTAVADGVRVRLKVTPKASKAKVGGLAPLVDGRVALKVAVNAPPVDGEANKAVIQALAKAWRVPKTSITVVSGETSRDKIVHVAGDPASLHSRLSAALTGEGGDG